MGKVVGSFAADLGSRPAISQIYIFLILSENIIPKNVLDFNSILNEISGCPFYFTLLQIRFQI